jgi:hypothetical protein
MGNEVAYVLTKIGEDFRDEISHEARHYLEIDIGKEAEKLGYSDIMEKYHDANAVVPLKKPVKGMKVRIDARTFVNYAQFESGIVVPGYVAREAGLPYRPYEANDSMIRNFA